MVEPKILKGFKDSLPEEEIIKRQFINKIEKALQKSGFVPIDTPALEYFEVLTGKGGEETDKQIFNFVDSGGRKVGLRFDLTVPLARFVAKYENQLIFPFKRYHISKVWRGEKPQKGRFREFIQADFDIIGSKGLGSDIEILETIISILTFLKIENFVIHLNDRELLKKIFVKLGVDFIEHEILKIFDKYYKTSKEWVKENIYNLFNIKKEGIISNIDREILNNFKIKDNNIIDFISNLLIELLIDTTKEKDFFSKLQKYFDIKDSRLELIYNHFNLRGLKDKIKVDGTISRGLDYYTGIVYETFVENHKEYGAICSGGRYDNLTSVFSKNVYSGVGTSIGIDRIIAYLLDNNLIRKEETLTDILIINFSEKYFAFYYDVSDILKSEEINTEIYLESAKLKKQFKYADKKNIRFCLIMGEDEIKNKIFKLKDMHNHKEFKFENIKQLSEFIINNR